MGKIDLSQWGFSLYSPPSVLDVKWGDYTTNGSVWSVGNEKTNYPKWSADYPYRAIFFGAKPVAPSANPTRFYQHLYVVYSKKPTTNVFKFEYRPEIPLDNKRVSGYGCMRAIYSPKNVQGTVSGDNDILVLRFITPSGNGTDRILETLTTSYLSNANAYPPGTYGTTLGSNYYFAFDFYYECGGTHEKNSSKLTINGVKSIPWVPYPYIINCGDHGRDATAQFSSWVPPEPPPPKEYVYSWVEVLHFGGGGLSGNFARQYVDMKWQDQGQEVVIGRSYNSRETRETILGPGWRFSLEGKIETFDGTTVVHTPDRGAQAFTGSGAYTAKDSHSTLVKEGNTHILTTADQYSYGYNADGYLVWKKDRNGNTVNITVDGDGKPTSVTDSAGRVTTIAYSDGKVSTVTDPAGRVVTYSYSGGRLSRATDPDGANTNYAYTSDGYLSQITNHNSAVVDKITYTMDENDLPKVRSLTDHMGLVKTYDYDMDARTVTVTDSNGRVHTTWYDASYFPIKEEDAEGRATAKQYNLTGGENVYGEVTRDTDRNGNTTAYAYDGRGNVLTVTNPDSSVRTFTYDSKNNVLTARDETGRTTYMVYDDSQINLVTRAVPLDGTAVYSASANQDLFSVERFTYYTAAEASAVCGRSYGGLLKTSTDPVGAVTAYTYDARGYEKTVTDPMDNTTTHDHNIIGWLKQETTPLGYRTSHYYNKCGALLKRVLHQGETERSIYNPLGLLTQEIAPEQYDSGLDPTTFTAEHIVNVTGSYGGTGHGLRHAYAANGTLTATTDANGYATSFAYDLYGNVLTATYPDRSMDVSTYDVMNRLETLSRKANASTPEVLKEGYAYDVLPDGKSTVTQTVYLSDTDTAVTVTTYDYAQRVVQVVQPNGGTVKTEYYPNGLEKQVTDARGFVTFTQYNGLGLAAHQWRQILDNSYRYSGWDYDKAGRVTLESISKSYVALNTIPQAGLIWKGSEYRLDGRIVAKTNSTGGRNLAAYDQDGNLVREEQHTSATEKILIEYTADHRGNMLTKTGYVESRDLGGSDSTLVPVTTVYTYDRNGNVKTITDPGGVTTTNFYDALNQLIRTEQPGLDEYGSEAVIATAVAYDWRGNVTQETDPLGNSASFTYDADGNPVRYTDHGGNTTMHVYDNGGHVVATVTPDNYRAGQSLEQMSRKVFTLDAMGQVLQETDIYLESGAPGGWREFVSKAYEYDLGGNPVKTFDARGYLEGYATLHTYNGGNQVLTMTDPETQLLGHAFTMRYQYDAAGRKVQETDVLGDSTYYQYDDLDNLTCMSTEPDGGGDVLERNEYDLAGNVLAATDKRGYVTRFEFNAMNSPRKRILTGDNSIPELTEELVYSTTGLPVRMTDSLGVLVVMEYDKQGHILSEARLKEDGSQRIQLTRAYDKAGNLRFETDAMGHLITYTYNKNGKPTSTSTTVSGKVKTKTIGYDAAGRSVSATDAFGNSAFIEYNPLGWIVRKIGCSGESLETNVYDDCGDRVSTADALGNVTRFEYDRNGRLTRTIDPMDGEQLVAYDAKGNAASETNETGNTVYKSYDRYNHLIEVRDKTQTVLAKYQYDLAGNLVRQEDGKGNVTSMSYNARGLQSSRMNPAMKVQTASYDARGNLLEKVDYAGNPTSYQYDIHGNPLSETTIDGTVEFTYDRNGNRLSMTDQTGTATYQYDEEGRVTWKDTPHFGVSTFEYDITTGLKAGYVAQKATDPNGNMTVRTLDNSMRLWKVQQDDHVAQFDYYLNGARKSLTYPGGARTDYSFDKRMKLKVLASRGGDGELLERFEYEYDPSGEIIAAHDRTGTTRYSYTHLGQLSTVAHPDGSRITYEYDDAGNRLLEAVEKQDQVQATAYSYDSCNRLLHTQREGSGSVLRTDFTYDDNGNLLTECSAMTQDVSGRSAMYTLGLSATKLVQHRYDAKNRLIETMSAHNEVVRNTYNGDGVRVAKAVNDDTTLFLYHGKQLILEADQAGAETARNVYGITPLLRTNQDGTVAMLTSGYSDVTLLLGLNGQTNTRYCYDSFGKHLEAGKADNPFRYSSYPFDLETENYYLRSRFYDPSTARFLQEDSYCGNPNDPLGLNLYTYCCNNPIRFYDHEGNVSIVKPIIDGVMGFLDQLESDYVKNAGIPLDEWEWSSWLDYIASVGSGVITGFIDGPAGTLANDFLIAVYDIYTGKEKFNTQFVLNTAKKMIYDALWSWAASTIAKPFTYVSKVVTEVFEGLTGVLSGLYYDLIAKFKPGETIGFPGTSTNKYGGPENTVRLVGGGASSWSSASFPGRGGASSSGGASFPGRGDLGGSLHGGDYSTGGSRPSGGSSGSSSGGSYTVVKNDNLWNIAKKYLGDPLRWREIYDLNKNQIKDPNLIYPGQTFRLPA